MLLFILNWRWNIRYRSRDSKGISKKRGENSNSSKGFEKRSRSERGNWKRESKSWGYCIGDWPQLICFCTEILLSVSFSWTSSQHPHVSFCSSFFFSFSNFIVIKNKYDGSDGWRKSFIFAETMQEYSLKIWNTLKTKLRWHLLQITWVYFPFEFSLTSSIWDFFVCFCFGSS